MVEQATLAILARLNAAETKKIVAFGDIPDGIIAGGDVKAGKTCADIEGCDFIVMSAESFYAFHGGKPAEKAAVVPAAAPADCCGGKTVDLTGKRLIHERDLRDQNTARGDVVRVSKNAIITALAHDYAKGIGAKIQKE